MGQFFQELSDNKQNSNGAVLQRHNKTRERKGKAGLGSSRCQTSCLTPSGQRHTKDSMKLITQSWWLRPPFTAITTSPFHGKGNIVFLNGQTEGERVTAIITFYRGLHFQKPPFVSTQYSNPLFAIYFMIYHTSMELVLCNSISALSNTEMTWNIYYLEWLRIL